MSGVGAVHGVHGLGQGAGVSARAWWRRYPGWHFIISSTGGWHAQRPREYTAKVAGVETTWPDHDWVSAESPARLCEAINRKEAEQ